MIATAGGKAAGDMVTASDTSTTDVALGVRGGVSLSLTSLVVTVAAIFCLVPRTNRDSDIIDTNGASNAAAVERQEARVAMACSVVDRQDSKGRMEGRISSGT